jgi:hypothetical protein
VALGVGEVHIGLKLSTATAMGRLRPVKINVI